MSHSDRFLVFRLVVSACVATLSFSCTSDPIQGSPIPGTGGGVRIEFVTPRGDHYLDTLITTGGKQWRFLLPRAGDCETIGTRDDVRYVNSGPLGSLRTKDLRCDPNGTLSLREWRDRISRARPPTIPTGLASYEIFYQDDDLMLARGNFPLLGLMGWTGGHDTVAVIPNVEVCQSLVDRKNATIEYRASGPVPLALLVKDGRCPLLGLAYPPK